MKSFAILTLLVCFPFFEVVPFFQKMAPGFVEVVLPRSAQHLELLRTARFGAVSAQIRRVFPNMPRRRVRYMGRRFELPQQSAATIAFYVS